MKKILAALCIFTAILWNAAPAAYACAGSLTSIGGSPAMYRKYEFVQRKSREKPARVGIYFQGSAKVADFAPQLQTYLTKEGQNARTFKSLPDLNEALKNGQLDLIVTILGSATDIQPGPSNPVIVPLVYELSKTQKAEVRKYKHRIENPGDGYDYLNAIYEVMKSRV